MEVEDSSLTIQHHIYSASEEFYISHRFKEIGHNFRRVSSRRAHHLEEKSLFQA
jgi:hypothetical protein